MNKEKTIKKNHQFRWIIKKGKKANKKTDCHRNPFSAFQTASNHFQNKIRFQFVVHIVGYVDTAVGDDAVGHHRRGDAFHAPFGRFERPNAVQGKQEIFFLFESDNVATVTCFVGFVDIHAERTLRRGLAD